MESANIPIKKGQFYEIYEKGRFDFVLEDKTKRGLEVRELSYDDKYGVNSEKGLIYDIDGIGHKIGIRWYFPKSNYSLQDVSEIAEELESKYRAIRELTCPDD